MKKLLFALMLTPLLSQAGTHSFNYLVNTDVPDAIEGIQNTQTIGDIGTLTSVEVGLKLTPIGRDGGWIGDLYAYLRHNDGSETSTSILLNRIGRSAANSGGLSGGPQIDITLSGSGLDIHTLAGPLGNLFTGSYSADGRRVDPASVLDTDPRTAGMGVFAGMETEGDWTLFVADASGGNQYRLDSWSLRLETEAVIPEDPGNPNPVPETGSVAVLGMVIGLMAVFRMKKRPAKPSFVR